MRFQLSKSINPLPPSDAVWKQKIILEDLFSSVLSQFKQGGKGVLVLLPNTNDTTCLLYTSPSPRD